MADPIEAQQSEQDEQFKQGQRVESCYQPIQQIQRKKKDDYAHSVFVGQLTLGNQNTQRSFETAYEELEYSFYRLSILGRISRDRELAEKAAKQVTKILSDVEAQMSAADAEIENAFNLNDIAPEFRVPGSSASRVYKPRFSTPNSLRFVRIYQKLDLILSKIDAAWINQIIDDDAYRLSVVQWVHILKKAIQRIHDLRRDYYDKVYAEDNVTNAPDKTKEANKPVAKPVNAEKTQQNGEQNPQ